MKVKKILVMLFLTLLLPISGCAGLEATGHEYLMRGQILEMKDDVAYLCIGSKDGAQVGQEYSVYKFDRVISHPKVNISRFKKAKTGTIRVTGIVDEHMATAQILKGHAKENYVVELNP
ncbi:MAG: hypothetical protein PSY14_16500 [bacterium]|nr:hypothetical protein [bacterium]